VAPEPGLGDAEAAARRDFTLNAIAYDPFADAIIDPHGGREDLARRVLRHTSAAFAEDPLRVLRGFQLAARFDLTLAPETAEVCRAIAPAYAELPVERVWGEWEKWAAKALRPSRGLTVLAETGWLAHFPEVAALRGTPQDPQWHPEGDVFVHTGHCLDALVRLPGWRERDAGGRVLLTLAVLAHDFGKPATTVRAERPGGARWTSPGHEAAGGPPAEAFLTRLGAPTRYLAPVRALVVNHLAHHHGQGEFSDSAVRRLARRLAPATVDELALVMRADAEGRPPLSAAEGHARIDALVAKARALALEQLAPRPILLGRHLIALGLAPGPRFRGLLDQAFEAQLDGAFADDSGAVAWARARLAAEGGADGGA
jgi:tRNA nucleotidyltransferase (CCA-adding enzyme)